MTRVLAVAVREVRERWLFLPAGLFLGFMPFVLPPALKLRGDDARFLTAFGVLVLMAAAAVVAGSGMLARDAAEGRLGFLFSRPVSWPTIWGGKWLGACSLAAGTGIAAALPTLAAGGALGRPRIDSDQDLVLIALVIVLGAGVANFGATAFRSRSPWTVLDLFLIPLTAWLARRWLLPALWLGTLSEDPNALWLSATRLFVAVSPLLLALVLASAVQLAVGRTDIRRAHRAMSLTFWAVVFLALSAAGIRLAWIGAATPSDLTGVYLAAPGPQGRWVFAWGPSRRGGTPGFLIDADRGRFVPFGLWSPREVAFGASFSADGKLAARLVGDAEGNGAALALLDLDGERPQAASVALESTSPPDRARTTFALSASGALALLAHESGISIFETRTGRRLATTTVAPGWWLVACRYLSEDEVRVWFAPSGGAAAPFVPRPSATPRAELRVVDLARDGRTRVVTFPTAAPIDVRATSIVVPDEDGKRVLTFDGGLHLRDGATGALLATLRPGQVSAAFLPDGRVAAADADSTLSHPSAAAPASLHVFDATGAPAGDVPLDVASPPHGFVVGPALGPDRMAVTYGPAGSPLAFATLVVDVGERRVVDRLPGLCPVVAVSSSTGGPVTPTATLDRFLRDQQGELVRFDPTTGSRQIVAGPGAPRGERIAVR